MPAYPAAITLDDLGGGGTIDLGGVTTTPNYSLRFNGSSSYRLANGTLVIDGLSGFSTAPQEIAADVTARGSYLILQVNGVTTISGAIKDRAAAPGWAGGPIDVLLNGTFTGRSTYTGTTYIPFGYLTALRGPDGALANTSAVEVETNTLWLDNAVDINDQRLPAAAPLTLHSGTLRFTGSSNGPVTQNLGAMIISGGRNDLVTDSHLGLATQQPEPATLALHSLTRKAHATLLIGFPGLPPDPNATVTVAQTPALAGAGGAAGTTRMSVLPWVATSAGDLVTVDHGHLRALDSTTEYAALAGASAEDNVRVSTSASLSGDRTINALRVDGGSVQLAAATRLTVSSGAVALGWSNGPTALSGAAGSSLNFGAAEGVIHVVEPARIDVPIVGTGGLTATGPETLTLSQPSPGLSGPVTINVQKLICASPGALGSGTLIASPILRTTLRFEGSSQTLPNDIEVDGKLDSRYGAWTALWTEVAPGLTVTHTGTLSGDGGLEVLGPGRLVLTGHSVTGMFTLDTSAAGDLQVDGVIEPGPGDHLSSIMSGHLSGTGTIAGYLTMAAACTIAPGDGGAPGTLTCTNFTAGAGYLVFAITGPTASQYSRLVATSTVSSLGGALVKLNLDYAPTPGTTFELIDNQGANLAAGTFVGMPEGAVVTAPYGGVDYPFRVSYVGGTGNDFVLTALPVPEPASAAIAAVACLTLLRRRQHARPR